MGFSTLVIFGLTLTSLGLSGYALSKDTRLNWQFAHTDPAPTGGAPFFENVFDYTAPTGQAHAPAILVETEGVSLIWFEGSAEAQADVDIWGVTARKEREGWDVSLPERRITRGGLGNAMQPRQLVVTLGNTIENEARADAMFATVVSVGGWAMASVADVHRGGAEARKLSLSPFLNRSHLVKNPMVPYADGSLGLPAYFELGATHGTLVRFAPDGRVRDQRRMLGQGNKPIQPMIVPLSETRAIAFLRDFDPSGVLLISRTEDGGQSWSAAEATQIANPSAPVAALALSGGRILMAMNDAGDGADALRLAISPDEGETWRMIRTLDDAGGARYPMMRRLPTGDIALAYSHSTKRGVRAYVFNEAWVDAQ